MPYDFKSLLLPDFNALLDLSEKRGWCTFDELNDALPDSDLPADLIEDLFAIVHARGIAVIESTD